MMLIELLHASGITAAVSSGVIDHLRIRRNPVPTSRTTIDAVTPKGLTEVADASTADRVIPRWPTSQTPRSPRGNANRPRGREGEEVMGGDFVFVDELVPGIRWDAKYATWDNFTGKPVDGYDADRIVGTVALCIALKRASEAAARQGLGLLLWDGYRPQRAVNSFLHWSQQPEDGHTKLRHYPNIHRSDIFNLGYLAAKSGHSRGSTIDLTLYRRTTGELVTMGGDHDLMDVVSHHDAAISGTATRNRESLRQIMESCGFSSYAPEWWHYTLHAEPYPDTYLDFPIRERLPL